MLDIILFIIGIGGFGLASYFDLKYTEFPDWVPYGMIAIILVTRLLFSVYYSNYSGFLYSALFGLIFLAIGLSLYFFKQWGDGDAWLFGVLGFILPNSLIKSSFLIPDYMSVILNFFLMAFVYIVAYSMIIGFNKPKVRKIFFRKIKGEAKPSIILSLIFLVAYSISMIWLGYSGVYLRNLTLLISFPLLIVFCVFFYHYARSVESEIFKRKIKAKDIRPGDVLIGTKWTGLTEKEIKKIRKRGGYVWIKEGVRFAPVYLITLIFSLFFGFVLF